MHYRSFRPIAAAHSFLAFLIGHAQYEPAFTSSQLESRTVDTSKEVGTLPGSSGVSATGGATYSIPIEVTPGTNGIVPQLAFSYNSQMGNGLLGYGWSLSGTSMISRTGQNRYHDGNVQPFGYTALDRFQLDGQRLILTSGEYGVPGSTYDTEQASFARIELIALAGNDERFWYFKMVTKEGMTLTYGLDWHSKILSGQGNTVMAWRLHRVADPYGNYMDHVYAETPNEGFESPLLEIRYTGNELTNSPTYDKVVFGYQGRADELTEYTAGVPFHQSKLLKQVEVFSQNNLVRRYELTYSWRDDRASYLNAITLVGADGNSSFNATRFAYGQLPIQHYSETTMLLDQVAPFDIFTGDLDGNGISDLIIAEVGYSFGIRLHTRLKAFLNGNPSPIPNWTYTMPALSIARLEQVHVPNTFVNRLFSSQKQDYKPADEVTGYRSASVGTSDLNGDGRDDILITTLDYHQNASGISIQQGDWEQNNGTGAWILSSFTTLLSGSQNGSITFAAPITFPAPIALPHIKSPSKFMEFGDFDADGRTEAVVVFNDINNQNASRSFLFDHEGWHELSVGSNMVAMSTIDLMRAADLDGDGRHELMVFRDHGTKTYQALNITDDHQLTLTASGWFNHTYAADDFQLWPADLNGDGVTDYLARTSSGWKTLVGRAHRVPGEQPFVEAPLELDVPFSNSHRIFVADLDGNGMSDILHYYPLDGVWKMRARYTYGMTSSGPLFHAPAPFNTVNSNSELIVGDYNGDGKQDIIGSNDYSSTITYTRFNQGAYERTLAVVSTGFCNRVHFNYQIHRRQGFEPLTYPLLSPGSIGLITSSITTWNNGLEADLLVYDFKMGRAHIAGRGFLGFTETSVLNAPHKKLTTQRNFEAPYYTPLETEVHSHVNETELSHVQHAFEQTPFGPLGSMGHYSKLTSTQTTDLLSGALTITENQWDEYGNVTHVVEHVNNDLLTTQVDHEYAAYGPSSIPNRVVRSTTISTRSGQDPATEVTTFDYDVKGGLERSTTFPGELLEVQKRLERNSRGSVTKESTTATSIPDGARTTEYVYDATSRFVLTKTLWWNKNGTMVPVVSKYLYNERWGVPTSELTPDGLTSLWIYDAFGRVSQTQIPHLVGNLRRAITQQRTWALDPGSGQTYLEAVSEPGVPRMEKYFNATGQLLRERTEVDHTGDWTTATHTYNNKGQLISSTEPHKSNEGFFTVVREFDELDRQVREVNSFFGETTIDYSYPGGGDQVITTTTPDQQVRTNRTDATGATLEAQDPGGTLKYTYNSRGAQTRVTLNNEIVALLQYDEYGRQTSLYDPNSGTTRYKYDAFGQLIYQRDADGNEVTSTYDNLGRIVRRTEPEGTTNWKYYHVGAKVINAPVSIEGTSSTQLFEYNDPYLRLTRKTEVIEGISYAHRYTYDDHDRITSEAYPSSLQVYYQYGTLGQLDRITYNGTTLFGEGKRDGGGRYIQYRLGALPITNLKYEHGLPLSYETLGISVLSMEWDPQTINLGSRWDPLKERHEAFEYDALNRLLSSTVSTTDQQGQTISEVSHHDYNYDGGNGQTKGNLIVKSDIGQLKYHANRVTSALNIDYPVPPDQPPYVINLETQTISYTSHHKARTISEIIDAQSHEVTYTYGPDQQRRTSTRREQGQLKETRTYVGNYEKQIIDGVTREIHYVHGGDGLCAMLVREGGTTKLYYVFKDHLGSIIKVVEPSGSSWTVVAEQNFDAWGRRRKPSTWEHDDGPSAPSWLYRGYTGHEHVEPFHLINMNGRMYDPLNGRMMGADPVVASPHSSQAFNRYSYAFNNPLKYTDPNGRLPILAIMALGAILNAGVQGFTVGFDNPWQFAGALIVGAASSAAGYGAAAGMTSLIGGSAMGFFNGALVGAAGGAAGGAVYGFGNSWNMGNSFNASLAAGWRDAKTGAWSGALTGGIAGGIAARKAGHGFWDGRLRVRETVTIPGININSTGKANCLADGFATVDQSFGGKLTPEDFRKMVRYGSDPDLTGLPLGESIAQYRSYSDRTMAFVEDLGWQRELLPAVQNDGARVLIMSPGLGMDHVTVLESITKTTVIGANGSLIGGAPRLSYRVMDPLNGGSYSWISLRNSLGALIIY